MHTRQYGPEGDHPVCAWNCAELRHGEKEEMTVQPTTTKFTWDAPLRRRLALASELLARVDPEARSGAVWVWSENPEEVGTAGRREEYLIGRQGDCCPKLQQGTVSRHHAKVEWKEHAWELRDLGSTHGTRVNGEKVTTARLRAGDLVEVGGIGLIFLAETF